MKIDLDRLEAIVTRHEKVLKGLQELVGVSRAKQDVPKVNKFKEKMIRKQAKQLMQDQL